MYNLITINTYRLLYIPTIQHVRENIQQSAPLTIPHTHHINCDLSKEECTILIEDSRYMYTLSV